MQTILVIMWLPVTIAFMAVAFVVTLGAAGPRPEPVLTGGLAAAASEPSER